MNASARPARAALVGAALMVAQQVAAKALRDAVFLADHPVTSLPMALAGSAALSVVLVLALAGAYSRFGPRRVVPVLCLVNAAALAVLAALLDRHPGAASFGVYLEVSVLGTVLLSGFWLQVSEALDPRSARRSLGTIGAAGAFGGVVGGAIGHWTSVAAGIPGTFVAVELLLVACAAAALAMPVVQRRDDNPERPGDPLFGIAVLRRHGYLRTIGALLALVSVAAALLDYLFKAHAVAAFAPEERLRVFAFFYAAAALLTFVAQAALGNAMLQRAGLGPTLATLPFGLGMGAALLALAPSFASAAIARGLEAVLRSSLFRAGYEQLFTPLDTAERRATKSLLDVGFDRLGDALGAGVISLLLLAGPGAAGATLAWTAFAVASLAVAVALRLPRGYVAALATGLARGAVALDPARAIDRTTRETMALTLRGLGLAALRAAHGEAGAGPDGAAASPASAPPQATIRLEALLSGEKLRVRLALAPGLPLSPEEIRAAAALLARDDLAPDALVALREAAARDPDPVVAALADRTLDPAARRRVPRALATAPPHRAVPALLAGLDDEQFDVRFACGRALARLHAGHPDAPIPADSVFAAVVREARRGLPISEAARFSDDAPGETEALLGAEIRRRAGRAIEHCFTMLLVAMPAEPLRVAWKALQTEDPMMRGTALEYLECSLPPEVRDALWPHLEAPSARTRHARPREEVVDDLLRAHPSIVIRLEELRGRKDSPGKGAGG